MLAIVVALMATSCELARSETVVERVDTSAAAAGVASDASEAAAELAAETAEVPASVASDATEASGDAAAPVGSDAPGASADAPEAPGPAAPSGDAAGAEAPEAPGPVGPSGDAPGAPVAAEGPPGPDGGVVCADRFDDEIPGLAGGPIRRDLANCALEACEVIAGGEVCFFAEDDDDRRTGFLTAARAGARDALSAFADWSLPIGDIDVLLSDNPRIFGETPRSAAAITYGAGPEQRCQVIVFSFADGAELAFTLAHELFHCIGYWGHVGADYENQVLWASEASPEWAAVAVVGSSSQAHPPIDLRESWAVNSDAAYGTWPFWAWVADTTGPTGVIEVLDDIGSNLGDARNHWRSLEAAGRLPFHDFVERSIAGTIPHVAAAGTTHTVDNPVNASSPFEVERAVQMPFAGWNVDVQIAESGRYRFGEANADATATVRHAGAWHGNGYEFDICDSGAVVIAVSSIAEESALSFGVDWVGDAGSCPSDDEAAAPADAPAPTSCPDGAFSVVGGQLTAAYHALLGAEALGSNFGDATVVASGGDIRLVVDGGLADVRFSDFTLAMTITVAGSDPFTAVATVNGGGVGSITPDTLTLLSGSVSVTVVLNSDFGPITEQVTVPISGSWPVSCDGVAILVGDAVGGREPALFVAE